MTRDEILADLYERLTSRKLWLCLLMLALAFLGYATGQLDYRQFETACLAAVAIFSGSEAVVGAARAMKAPRPPARAIDPRVDPEERLDADERHKLLTLIHALGPDESIEALDAALFYREHPHET